jgi:hypothetical protein
MAEPEVPTPITVTPPTATVNLTPFGFLEWASQFLQAANSIGATEQISPVRYFLVCRSVELALKAFLLAGGFKKRDLRGKLGHRLTHALLEAERMGLGKIVPLSADEKAVLSAANDRYSSKRFEYFEIFDAATGYRDLPSIDLLSVVAERLVSGVKQTCLDAS